MRERQRLRSWMLAYNRHRRPFLPKCDAIAKSTIQRCGNPAAKGKTKCRLHGGATGSGKNWHKRVFAKRPKASGATIEKVLARKIRDQAKDAKQRAERVAAMTADERASYDLWHKHRKPGPSGPRAAEREQRRQNTEIATIITKERPADPIVDALQQEIDRGKEQIARLETQLQCLQQMPFDIFS